jgi:hypothetical protein
MTLQEIAADYSHWGSTMHPTYRYEPIKMRPTSQPNSRQANP